MFSYLDIGDLSISLIYLSLVVMDFKLTEIVYDKAIALFLQQNEKFVHKFFKTLHKIMEHTIYGWLLTVRDILLALISGFIPMLPGVLQTALDYMGFIDWLAKHGDKYKHFEEKKRLEAERKEKAKQIEKERPESPKKVDKIEFPVSSTLDTKSATGSA